MQQAPLVLQRALGVAQLVGRSHEILQCRGRIRRAIIRAGQQFVGVRLAPLRAPQLGQRQQREIIERGGA